jgi:hypothetical protein
LATSKLREHLLRLGPDRNSISEQIRTNQLTADTQRLLLFMVRVTPWCLVKLKKRTLQVGKLKDLLWGKKSESAKAILKEIDDDEEEEAAATAAAATIASAIHAQTSANAPLEFPAVDCAPQAEVATAGPAAPENTQDKLNPSAPNNVIPITQGKRKYKKNRKSSPRGRAAYPDVTPIEILHTEHKSGDPCPKCERGRLYKIPMGVFFIWLGRSMLKPIIYLQQKFRCNRCGWITAAKMPIEAVAASASATAAATIAVLKYGGGLPFFRTSKIQGWLKMPISPSTLWNQLKNGLIEVVEIIWNELRKLAAQGEVIHNDDTTGKILSLMAKPPQGRKAGKEVDPKMPKGGNPKKKPRKAISTTGILSKTGERLILLFFTGHANAGENLEELLQARDESLAPPIQMSDAGTTNRPGKEKTLESLCLTHGRRGFIRSYRSEKKASAFVILKLKKVYKIEAQAKREGLNAEERLKLHQEKSAPVMSELKTWLDAQIETKQVEANSALGEAIEYMRNHWSGLTAFLRIPGAPLTNDELEQAFKNVKTFLKNALFYKTLFGARVGDMMMSVIHTTVLAGENPWEYLVELQKNRQAVKNDPSAWLPWTFRQTLLAAGAGSSKMSA